MANLLCIVSLLLILACASADGYKSREYKIWSDGRKVEYRCKHGKDFDYESKLGLEWKSYKNFAAPAEKIEELLKKAESDEYFGDITIGQLRDLGDLSKAKCSLNEFFKRRYFTEINPESPAINYIAKYDVAVRKFCEKSEVDKARIAKEVEAATNADRVFIEKVMSIGNPEGKDLSDHGVRASAKRYFNTLPGSKEFVRDARRLRVLYACDRIQDFRQLVWWYASVNAQDWSKVCKSYHDNFDKISKQDHVDTNLAKAKKFGLAVGYAGGLVLYAAAVVLLIVVKLVFKIMDKLTFGLPKNLIKFFLGKSRRDPDDPKYMFITPGGKPKSKSRLESKLGIAPIKKKLDIPPIRPKEINLEH